MYDLAGAQRRRWRGDETLNTTALVHEVYLKLSRQQEGIRNPECLLAVASRAMRHVLVNYAEERLAAKRGGYVARVPVATLGPLEDEQTSCTLEEFRVSSLSGRRSRPTCSTSGWVTPTAKLTPGSSGPARIPISSPSTTSIRRARRTATSSRRFP